MDRQETDVLVYGVSSCGASIVTINATDYCGNHATATVPVQIDSAPPTAMCSFGGSTTAFATTSVLAKQMYDVSFEYDATDACGKPIQVDVQVFSSEREGQFSGPVVYRHNMAILYNDKTLPNNKTKMLLQHHICPKPTNGQCVKDLKVQDARLYTAHVTATDAAGLVTVEECTLTILPVDPVTFNDIDTTQSTQRHLIAQYASVFTEY